MLLGVARPLTGVNVAWVFQPYLACCAAAVSLCLYALMESVVPSKGMRALLAFVAAQAALLYGYSLWGGIKELTAAFLLALGAALAAPMLAERPRNWRRLIPLAVAAGALFQTLGVGAAGWVVPTMLLMGAYWLLRDRENWRPELRASSVFFAKLAALVAVFIVPVWSVLATLISGNESIISGLFSSGQSVHTQFGNLLQSLSVFQLAGIWPVNDFRLTAPTLSSTLFVAVVLLATGVAVYLGVRRRQLSVVFYVALTLVGCVVFYLSGATPWVVGKTLAISSPALLLAALVGGGMLWGLRGQRRALGVAGLVVVVALSGGVLYSNFLQYQGATLAPRPRLAELQRISELVAGHGPVFMNEYEIYATRHFLRDGQTEEPSEYREPKLPLRNGVTLTKGSWADIDSFPLTTLLPYRSIVTRNSPVESRPPSVYKLVWQGEYYDLWQRPDPATATILEHIPYGESNLHPYCGSASHEREEPLAPSTPWRRRRVPRLKASRKRRRPRAPNSSPTSVRSRLSPTATRRCGPLGGNTTKPGARSPPLSRAA